MKKIVSLLLCLVLIMSTNIPINAEEIKEEMYGCLKVEFSDKIGETEYLNVMVKDKHVYVNARELASRLGYRINEKNEEYVVIYNIEDKDLPYSFTQFYYDDVKVDHMVCLTLLDNYEAPFPSIYNREGIWIPLEYSLYILNSSMLLLEDMVLIDMPKKNISDIYVDILRNNNVYAFDFTKDFGYSNDDVVIIGASSHVINQFNGLLQFDGVSWVQLFQSLALDSSSYDHKYGENMAMLLCTESDGELDAIKKEIELYQDIFSEKGKLGELLSTYSELLDKDIGVLQKECNIVLEKIRNSNSTTAEFNKTYVMLEKAFDKQTMFSHTGEIVLDVQKRIASDISLLDVAENLVQVVAYGQEFSNQDEFSVSALDNYLEKSRTTLEITDDVKKSMKEYSRILKKNFVEYSSKRYFEENIDEWIEKAITDGKVLGSQANMILLAWDFASDYIPFISKGLNSANSFELALYSLVLQADTFFTYQTYRNFVFENKENISSNSLYTLSQYCYLYMKTCYITRDAALTSLDGRRESAKEQIQPLIDYHNSINNDIAEILIQLKKAKKNNEGYLYGFLPDDNKEYLEQYSDEKVILLVDKYEIVNQNNESESKTDQTVTEASIINAIYMASAFAWDWFWDSSREHVDENDTYIEMSENGDSHEYKRVNYEGISCVNDVIELAQNYFTEDIARELVGYKEWYEIDNRLYVSEPDGIGAVDPDYYKIIIEKKSENLYSIVFYEYYGDEFIGKPYEVHYKLVNGNWVFDQVLVQAGENPIPIYIESKSEMENVVNQQFDLLGIWFTEQYNELDNWAVSYKTTFMENDIVIQEGWRNKDKGEYEKSSDGKYVIAHYTENYVDVPGEGWVLIEGYEYTVTYEVNAEEHSLYAIYSNEFEEMLVSNATNGVLRKEIY